MVELLALRFRDLAGPTIDEHRAVIDEHGYVWWGWWSKPGEAVPRDVLAAFLDRIGEQGHVEWLLIDSGNQLVYRAHVTSIVYSPGSEPFASPEVERTPAYYGRQKYRAWFRITAIEEATEEDLTANTYEELAPKAFDEDPHREAFNGKRVFSIAELLSRHRTIYFLRRAHAGDPEHLASLAPSEPVRPFMSRTLQRPSDYVVQISDMHFGAHHAFPRTSGPIHPNLALRITEDIKQLYPGVAPAAVILSGDFSWRGEPGEFEWAREFVTDLRSILNLDASDFLVCPGNHDICWAMQGAQYDPSAPVTVASGAAQANYIEFVKNAFGLELAPGELAVGRHLLLANGVALDIIALNSSQLEQQDFAGYGFVSGAQMNRAIEEMGWRADKGARYRMLVLHHHVVPVVSVEAIGRRNAHYSVTLDAGEVLYRSLELEVDLIAHGHMHQSFGAIYGRLDAPDGHVPDTRRVAIQAAGSVGVDAEHLPSGVGRNSYLIYEFTPGYVRVRRRATSPHADRFDEDGEHLLDRRQAGRQ
jgi:3',5'-cyclic AMP phosphodiesterase CpdA